MNLEPGDHSFTTGIVGSHNLECPMDTIVNEFSGQMVISVQGCKFDRQVQQKTEDTVVESQLNYSLDRVRPR